MQILDGKETSKAIRQELAEAVEARKAKGQKIPHLAAVLVGNDGGSLTYVGAKVRACKEIGFESSLFHLEDSITEDELLAKVHELNNDDEIDGFIVQLPLPKHIDEKKITLAIDPKKDVDGFHPTNLGNMVLNLPGFLPATPAGMLELFKRYDIETSGKHCVVIGRSHIVGSPMSILMGRSANPGNATVTLTHSRTQNLKELTLQADIIITAIGKPNFLTADMVKDGVVIMDVGITRVEDASKKSGYKITGDVNFESVAEKASYITPVPGGVGPMTIVSLMMNTLKAMEINHK
ncbi:bifunctional 5,10-methylenetetrahydrofolate dehydrogenase/5,10-methenyltetrahydrofolate cyclohydrolase [Brumimicrobium aurantiacum]|uniref:Bifunctional protein FolD n=1 Tax=Brumimicrobium aurantiacum TaxID=1737063 RepID=A0A3E1EVC8_9FLAO|nr:tetrahydrofolate dehydrogenase/cyclohydrolase catalytic domain-containing protein [Brumimicrobium aurantiacum]RFC53507.1 bifunctional 5,10-methylene-tetrahydrofolate dehydrogenase/5,10-methylene-tetrahydrofolate cyclohydrolase [Brumimicrobium aurantiacum]